MPPSYFPMCQNGEKQQSPELATPLNEYSKRVQNLPPSKNGGVQNLPPLNSKFLALPIFGGGKFWTQSFQSVASSGLCCFSPFWHIGKLGGGKKSGPPCIIIITYKQLWWYDLQLDAASTVSNLIETPPCSLSTNFFTISGT